MLEELIVGSMTLRRSSFLGVFATDQGSKPGLRTAGASLRKDCILQMVPRLMGPRHQGSGPMAAGPWLQGSWLGAQGSGLRDQGPGPRAQGSGLRAQGLWV